MNYEHLLTNILHPSDKRCILISQRAHGLVIIDVQNLTVSYVNELCTLANEYFASLRQKKYPHFSESAWICHH